MINSDLEGARLKADLPTVYLRVTWAILKGRKIERACLQSPSDRMNRPLIPANKSARF